MFDSVVVVVAEEELVVAASATDDNDIPDKIINDIAMEAKTMFVVIIILFNIYRDSCAAQFIYAFIVQP